MPGLSPLFPNVHCTADGDVCQVITGEGEINAATTIASFVRSPRFDLTTSYFMIAGIAGVNPEVATICSVTFARYAVQVALQYEFDIRDLPALHHKAALPQMSTHKTSTAPKSSKSTRTSNTSPPHLRGPQL